MKRRKRDAIGDLLPSLRSNDEVDKHKQCTWNFQFHKNYEVLDQKWVKFVCRKESKHHSVWPLRVKIFNLWKTESTIKFELDSVLTIYPESHIPQSSLLPSPF